MPMRAERVNIVTLDVDAIVNAANSRLLPGSGVCGAIHRGAGPDLAAACERIYRCPTGEARITPGFRLTARHVIHTVGPVWSGGKKGEAESLTACYRNSLALLRETGGASVAFPAISTGTYGFPAEEAAAIAVRTVRDDLTAHGDIEVVFSCFDDRTLALYEKELAA